MSRGFPPARGPPVAVCPRPVVDSGPGRAAVLARPPQALAGAARGSPGSQWGARLPFRPPSRAATPCVRAKRQPAASGLGNRWRYSNRSALKDNRNLIGRRLAIRLGARLGGGEEELQRVLERRGLGNVTEQPRNTSRAEVPSNRRRLHAGNRPAHRLSAARHHLGLVR